MTRRCTPILLFTAAAMLVALQGCASEDGNASEQLEVTRRSQIDTTDAGARDVVRAYIQERTTEGSPYFIQSSAAELEYLEDDVERSDGTAICRALFRATGSKFLVEYVLHREFERFVITRVMLKAVDDEPVERLLFDRDSLVL